MQKEFLVLGLMSGTSLDGLDLALCHFSVSDNRWNYTIERAETIPYSESWEKKLRGAEQLPSIELLEFHSEYGKFLGLQCKYFLGQSMTIPTIIASHGHTIFHRPDKGFTYQLGHGSAIAAATGIDTIWDFRSGDVLLGGQGAPLVPIGDQLLFPEFDICLNLGGFGNLSYQKGDKRIAYDTTVVNMALNELAREKGLNYDRNGDLGRNGSLILQMLEELNSLDYYSIQGPKSLGKEWYLNAFKPIIDKYSGHLLENRLFTVYEHIAQQTINAFRSINAQNVLVTGGGAKNGYFISLLRSKTNINITIPDVATIDFKEALIFAFLGVLFLERIPGSLASVTGASGNSIAGVLSKGCNSNHS